MLYLVIANLPRSERYKLENVMIVGVLPGLREPKKNMNSYLKPLVNELWKGIFLSAPGVFVPVRCALLCVSCDLLHEKCVALLHSALYKDAQNA